MGTSEDLLLLVFKSGAWLLLDQDGVEVAKDKFTLSRATSVSGGNNGCKTKGPHHRWVLTAGCMGPGQLLLVACDGTPELQAVRLEFVPRNGAIKVSAVVP